jgi:hypothetical protein
MARLLERELRRFRHNSADPAWPASSPRTSPGTPPRSPNAPGLPTATATCTRPICWQRSPGTVPAR